MILRPNIDAAVKELELSGRMAAKGLLFRSKEGLCEIMTAFGVVVSFFLP